MTERVIIAGVDGTDSSLTAVNWAAVEADRRGLPLRIVYAFDWDRHESGFDIGNEHIDVARHLADAVVAYARGYARAVAPNADVSTDTLVGHAVHRLLEVSRDAELLVLGSRCRGGFKGLLLGSVSRRIATRAPCPVVVVRGPAAPDGSVAAGVDDSPADDDVLAAAFEAAADRDRPLTVIHSRHAPGPVGPAGLPSGARADPERDAVDRERFAERLLPWRDEYPGVQVKAVLTHDGAAAALVEASRSAQLVVMGSGRGGTFSRAVLGSTVRHVLHHADSPVLITQQDAENPR